MDHAALIDDADEKESLLQSCNCMSHGVLVDSTPMQYEGRLSVEVNREELPIEYDDKNKEIFSKIGKLSKDDWNLLEQFKLTLPCSR